MVDNYCKNNCAFINNILQLFQGRETPSPVDTPYLCRQRNTTSVTIDTNNCLQTGNIQESDLERGALLGDRTNNCRTPGVFITGQ